jgi:polyferredoxin
MTEETQRAGEESAATARFDDLRRLARRIGPQPVVRGAFFVFFVWLCWRLWAFAQWAMGAGPYVSRPEAVAGIIPIGALLSFFTWLRGGGFDVVVPAGVVIIIGAVVTSLVFKRSFCGWICPVGTPYRFFEWLGVRTFGRTRRPPRWLDWVLRSVKWAFALLLIVVVTRLPLIEAVGFQRLPFYATADIAILRIMLTWQWWAVAGTAAVASVFWGNIWCRYLCPLGGAYSVVSMASPCTVTRDPDVCIDCGTCSKQCHAWIDVQHSVQVRSSECDGCLNCVRSCPEPGALDAKVLGKVRVKPWVWAACAVALWLLVYGVALATGHWKTGVPLDAWPAYVHSVLGRGI